MSELRRRIFGTSGDATPTSTPDESREGTPIGDKDYRIVPVKKLDNLTTSKKSKGTKRRNVWVFGLGGLFGLVLAGFFASSNEFMDLVSMKDLNLDSIFDVLPAGLINDARDLQVRRASLDPFQVLRDTEHETYTTMQHIET